MLRTKTQSVLQRPTNTVTDNYDVIAEESEKSVMLWTSRRDQDTTV